MPSDPQPREREWADLERRVRGRLTPDDLLAGRRRDNAERFDLPAQVLCAYVGSWEWHTLNEGAKARWREIAREVIETHEDGDVSLHLPLLHGLGIGFDYGGAGAPPCR